jgi:hypothetical protein
MLRHHAALVSGKLTRVPSGVNLPPSEVIMSRRRDQWGTRSAVEIKGIRCAVLPSFDPRHGKEPFRSRAGYDMFDFIHNVGRYRR